jgi:coenzyme F420-reducing hydrogenase delta subunit
MRLQYPGTIRIIKVPCTGKVDLAHILRSFEKGADGVRRSLKIKEAKIFAQLPSGKPDKWAGD